MRLVIASNNANKRKEIIACLQGSSIEVVDAAATIHVDVTEDGETFAANARKKAVAFARANQALALADDSGLCVDALGGAPGVCSARFAGENADDAANNARLLHVMHGLKARQAHFVCHLCLANADGQVLIEVSGQSDGYILEQHDGAQGFGYDPLFFSPALGKSFARASAEEKASVSHRGRALRRFRQALKDQQLWT